jgi:endonuclease/exonuclease/phosphatase family metal-dependent hydrolase
VRIDMHSRHLARCTVEGIVKLMVFAAVGCALVLSLPGCSQSPDTRAALPRPNGTTYTLMQMNLCLSGLAGCYDPRVVEEAMGRIRELHPDAVTFNEACAGDAAQIARRTGYHLRFSRVIYLGRPLDCIHPGGRGLFGDAVLTKAAIESTDSRPFNAQAGIERRVWLCVTTRVRVDVCTAHLTSQKPDEAASSAPQCAELRMLLARRAAGQSVIFAGDVNRRSPCPPEGFWTLTDGSAEQDPGDQHVYGTDSLRSPSAEVIPTRHTDHAVLLVRARLPAPR